tara:strand:- start:50 stop:661 length:612 start_codon:yes stop_codon:yes gene_type:complete
MDAKKNIIEIVRNEDREDFKELDKILPKKFKSKKSNNIHENIILMITSIAIQAIDDLDKLPITPRYKKSDVIKSSRKNLTDSEIIALTVFIGLLHIYAYQNLKEADRDDSRLSNDNIKIIAAIFFMEDIATDKTTIELISHGLGQISKMVSHEDKTLRKILTTFQTVVNDYIKTKGKLGLPKKDLKSFRHLFKSFLKTIMGMY